MAGRAINNRAVRHVFAIVDEDSPDVDEDEQSNIGQLLQWEDEWEDVIWHALGETIDRVESMTCIWSRHDPLVVWLMECLVDHGMMQPAVYEVNEEVGEEYEEGELEIVVQIEWCLGGCIVKFSITSDLGSEERSCEDSHDGH